MGWQPIETAPRDKHLLLYGTQLPCEGINMAGPVHFTGYWDAIDEAWCSTGSTWTGPFYEPTHWMPLPRPPA